MSLSNHVLELADIYDQTAGRISRSHCAFASVTLKRWNREIENRLAAMIELEALFTSNELAFQGKLDAHDYRENTKALKKYAELLIFRGK